MNFIQLILHPKMMIIRNLISENTQSYRLFGVVLLLMVVFFSMIGPASAEESTSAKTIVEISLSREALSTVKLKEHLNSGNSFTGRIQLLTQSQITPTISSYPAPLSPTVDPTANPFGGIEEPYPDLTPDSTELPLMPYPEAQNGQIPNSSPNPEIAQTPAAQNPISPPSIGSNQSEITETNNIEQTQPFSAVSAVILWLGFLASLMIFLSAILWSILYYSRQSSRE